MAITPLPPAPEPTDSTAQFNTKAFAFVASLDGFVTETNATAVQATAAKDAASVSATASANSATASANSASAASDSADAAATSAETAAAATNAVLWVSGTTYAIGFLVYSPLDNRVYRRLTAGAGTTDPSADATNWVQLTRVVEQSDIGTAPNEIPLNQYLGSMAYQDAENIAGDVGAGGALTVVGETFVNKITASTGILFGTDTAAANTLDDYEEGTWTPSLGGDATYTVQEGTYTKIGDTVYIKGAIRPNVLGTGSVSTVTGLPFAPVSGYDSGLDVGFFDFMPNNVIFVGGAVSSSGILFYGKATASTSYVGVNVFADGGGRIRFSATYKTLG